MKIFLLFSVAMITLCGNAFSQQCPQAAFKIQSPVCDTPQNLRATIPDCNTAKLSWQGNSKQQYVVEVTGKDAADNTLFQTKAANYSCDNKGNCFSTINVQEGEKVNWNVQAVCNINNAAIYSPKVEGKAFLVPSCQVVTAEVNSSSVTKNQSIRVYPNPAVKYLQVEYQSITAGDVQLSIFDVNGKLVVSNHANAITGSNRYTLDLRNVVPGTYLLKVYHNGAVGSVTFVVIGK